MKTQKTGVYNVSIPHMSLSQLSLSHIAATSHGVGLINPRSAAGVEAGSVRHRQLRRRVPKSSVGRHET